MNTQAVSSRLRAGRYSAIALGAGAVLALGILAPSAAQAAAPTTLYVSHGGLDSGTCTSASPCATVSYALTKAASGATIKVSGTIDDHVNISHPVTITTWPGGPARSPAVLDGTASGGVVFNSAVGVTLKDLSIENGGNRTVGAGIANVGTMTVIDSTVSGNNAQSFGGGIDNDGTMTVIDSTISGNAGGGIENGVNNHATLTIIASTVSNNTGGGIISNNTAATASLGATIVAGNTGGNCVPVFTSNFSSAGYNLTSDKTGKACAFTAATDRVNKNPLLGHLAKNGGPTKTLLPGATSPADDVIPKTVTLRGVTVCPGTDQRGVTRPAQGDTRCTIGAVEV